MSAINHAATQPGSETYERYAEQLRALLAAESLAGGNPWVRIGRYEFRASAGVRAGFSWAATGPQWEAKAVWGRYEYAVSVTNERDAVALALGLACFTSKSGGRGRRTDIRIQWRDR